MQTGLGEPIDWTNGTGVLPAGGNITVPANPYRQSIFLQNQGSALTVALQALTPAGAASTANIQLAEGVSLEFGLLGMMTSGAFTVRGTAGAPLTLITN